MEHIYKYDNFSLDYYTGFKKSDFPKSISLSKPCKVNYKLTEVVAGSNKVYIKYILDSKQPDSDNPYKGNVPEYLNIDIGFTYIGNKTKAYVTIVNGARHIATFSYYESEIDSIEETDYRLSRKTMNSLKKALKKNCK